MDAIHKGQGFVRLISCMESPHFNVRFFALQSNFPIYQHLNPISCVLPILGCIMLLANRLNQNQSTSLDESHALLPHSTYVHPFHTLISEKLIDLRIYPSKAQ